MVTTAQGHSLEWTTDQNKMDTVLTGCLRTEATSLHPSLSIDSMQGADIVQLSM